MSGDCEQADEAFGSAWSAERRKAVTTRYKGARDLLPAAAMLDGLRRDWIKRYDKACAQSSSAMRHEQLACLLEARDDINEATQELVADDGALTLAGLIPLNMALAACSKP